MAFVFEVLTEEDKQRYNTNPEMRDISNVYGWYIDKEQDVSIWGALAASHWQEMADGDYSWVIFLRYRDQYFIFNLEAGEGSKKFSEIPYIIVWDHINDYHPKDLHGYPNHQIIDVLKAGLSTFGRGYWTNRGIKDQNFQVKFGF